MIKRSAWLRWPLLRYLHLARPSLPSMPPLRCSDLLLATLSRSMVLSVLRLCPIHHIPVAAMANGWTRARTDLVSNSTAPLPISTLLQLKLMPCDAPMRGRAD